MHLSTHLGWQNVDLASDLRKQIALPIRIMNNVRAAALLSVQQLNLPAESGHFYLRIAEGIGGALVQHGVVFTGNSWTAGEAGHLTVQPNGPRCSCNRQGCLEAMISKPAINQQLAQRQPGLTWHSRDSAPNVVNEVMQLAGNYLGIALSQIMLLLNPATIIIDCPGVSARPLPGRAQSDAGQQTGVYCGPYAGTFSAIASGPGNRAGAGHYRTDGAAPRVTGH